MIERCLARVFGAHVWLVAPRGRVAVQFSEVWLSVRTLAVAAAVTAFRCALCIMRGLLVGMPYAFRALGQAFDAFGQGFNAFRHALPLHGMRSTFAVPLHGMRTTFDVPLHGMRRTFAVPLHDICHTVAQHLQPSCGICIAFAMQTCVQRNLCTNLYIYIHTSNAKVVVP